MQKNRNYEMDPSLIDGNETEPTPTIENPVLARAMEQRRNRLGHAQSHAAYQLDKILDESRVIIIEGISGSGKDTFQKYLKSKLRGRVVHDYAEGELLWSWKHQQIKDIFKIQIHLMRNFLEYVACTLQRDKDAVFLLNRFHLSTYTMYTSAITEQSNLEREYNQVIKALLELPSHVFLLQLKEHEMETRSSHPERGVAWRKFQQHILEREGFGNFVKRNVTLQKSMFDTAMRHKVPYSILRLPTPPELGIVVRRSPNTRIIKFLNASFQTQTHKPSRLRHPSQHAS